VGLGACPTGAQVYCEAVALDVTSPSQAQDACNACLGVGGTGCAPTAAADGVTGVDGYTGDTDYYVYANVGTDDAGVTADPNCTPTAYTPAAGQVFSQTGGVCSSGNW
jgi:hypothetical protein